MEQILTLASEAYTMGERKKVHQAQHFLLPQGFNCPLEELNFLPFSGRSLKNAVKRGVLNFTLASKARTMGCRKKVY